MSVGTGTLPVPDAAASWLALRHFQSRSGRLSYVLSGAGAPSIVLFSGAGVPLEAWSPLYPAIERLGRVLAWNRFGVKESDPPRRPQTSRAIVSSLKELLDHAALTPPYVLVAHSLGGLHANLFARLHPGEVAAVLLLEAAHPRDRRALREGEAQAAQAIKRMFALPQRRFRANLYAEIASLDETARELQRAGPFPQIPITVITGVKAPPRKLMSAAAAARRRSHQRALARLSPLSRQIVAARSGHFPQRSDPQLVLRALQDLVARAGYAVSPL